MADHYNAEINIARAVYDAYPHSDLLPIDPEQDCRSLQSLLAKVTTENIGDALFRFLIVEIVEGGESTPDGAIDASHWSVLKQMWMPYYRPFVSPNISTHENGNALGAAGLSIVHTSSLLKPATLIAPIVILRCR